LILHKYLITSIIFACYSLTAFSDELFTYIYSIDEIVDKIEKTYVDSQTKKEINFQWIMDKNRDFEVSKNIAMVNGAVTSGIKLDRLSKYGLVKQAENIYNINVAQNYNWLNLSNLFNPITHLSSKETIFSDLLDRGFDRGDIQILDVYITENNYSSGISSTIKNFRNDKAKEVILEFMAAKSSGAKSRIFFESNENFRIAKYNYEMAWIYALYDSFDQRAQRILIFYLSENISSLTLTGTNLTIHDYESQMKNFLTPS
jgi:hypothetical protein